MKILNRTFFFGLASVIATSPFVMSAQAADAFTAEQTQSLQQIIHDYIVQNPQVLVEASDALQQQQENQMVDQVMSAVAAQSQAIFNGNSPVAGNPNGDVTLVEFFDYQCPHCKTMQPVIKNVIDSDSNLRVVFKQLPIFGENSVFAAKAALAADKQGKFYQFHEALMAEPVTQDNLLTQDRVLAVARNVGLDVNQLVSDINSEAINDQLNSDLQLAGRGALELMGTPAMIISKYSVSDGTFSIDDTYYIPGETSEGYLKQVIEQSRTGQ